jgi:predicted nucleotide-binding protein
MNPASSRWRGSLRCLQSIAGQLNAGFLRRKVASDTEVPESLDFCEAGALIDDYRNLNNVPLWDDGHMDNTDEQIAVALVDKGIGLHALGRHTEAIAAYDDLIGRFDTATETPIREQVAIAFRKKGDILVDPLGRHTEAIAVYDELIGRFGTATETPIREQVAIALRKKGDIHGDQFGLTEAIAAYDDLIGRFGTATETPIPEQVAIALRKKGDILGDQLGRHIEAIVVYDDLIGRFGTAHEEPIREHVAIAFRKKGDILGDTLGRHTEAFAVYDEFIDRFSTATGRPIREQVALARASRIRVVSTTVPTTKDSAMSKPSRRVFIVHSHDVAARESVARLVERAELEAVILREQPNQGRTIIEKFEQHSETAGFAIVLLTPDDVGGPCGTAIEQLRPRARQNVVAELFFFIGKLGRNKVCALVKGSIELPSDFAGVVYEQMDEAGHWQLALPQEMLSAGLAIDLNTLFRR